MLQTRFLMFWALVVASVGCAGGDDPVEPTGSTIRSERDAGVLSGCSADLECAGGERCINGSCVVASGEQCTSDGQCPNGQICRGDRCVPDPVGCANDGDCPGGGRCSNGRCNPPDPSCVADRDCESGEMCLEGECVAPMPECQANEDCRPGQQCDDGQCVGDGMGGCAEDGDCPAGQLCRGGVCIGPRPQCDENADCRMGQLCEEGRCVDLPNCVVDGDCPQDWRCENSVCVEAGMGGCRDNADCPGGQTCQGGMCVGPAARCEDDAECADGERCENGDCVPPDGRCRDAGDCPAGSVCMDGECVEEMPECVNADDCGPDQECDAGMCVGGAPEMEAAAACAGAIRGGPGMYEGETMGDSVAAGSCGRTENSPEAVYALSFAADGEVCLSTAGTEFDTVLYVRTECRDPAAELMCNDDNFGVAGGSQSALAIEVTAGETYYAFVDGYALNGNLAAGPYQLLVYEGACNAGPDPDPDPEPDPEPEDPPPACAAGPDVIGVGEAVNGTTAGVSTADGSCGRADGPEAIHQLQVLGGGLVCITTEGSDFDTILYVRTECEDSNSEAGCDDDNGEGLTSSVELDAELGVVYFLFVDGYDEAAGDYILTVSEGACP